MTGNCMIVTQEMVDAFTKAWEAKQIEIGEKNAHPGTKTRAGLEAVFEIVDRDLS